MGTENMKICIVSFTKKGYELSCDIAYKLEKSVYEAEVFTKCSRLSDENIKNFTDENYRNTGYISQNISDWTAAQMSEKKSLIFIGACGIAVRAIASSVNNKLKDSPVIVIDELGQFVIPILSGHVGGANELAVLLAAMMNATPVITTATDINNKFAVDVFAKKCRLAIVNKDGIAGVSSKVLAGEVVTMSVDWEHIPAKHRSLIKAFLDEADMSADVIKTVDFPPAYGADIVVSCEKAKDPKNGSIYLKPTGILLTNREFHLQTGNLAYKNGFSFTKRESWVTKGILGLLFTLYIFGFWSYEYLGTIYWLYLDKNAKKG